MSSKKSINIKIVIVKQRSLILCCLLFAGQLFAQNYQKTALGLKTKLQSMDVEVQFYSPSIVRVLKSPQGVAFKKESLSVNKKPQQTKFTIQQKGDILSLKSEKLKVDVDVKSGK